MMNKFPLLWHELLRLQGTVTLYKKKSHGAVQCIVNIVRMNCKTMQKAQSSVYCRKLAEWRSLLSTRSNNNNNNNEIEKYKIK